jgi:hypothetical protein
LVIHRGITVGTAYAAHASQNNGGLDLRTGWQLGGLDLRTGWQLIVRHPIDRATDSRPGKHSRDRNDGSTPVHLRGYEGRAST